MQLKACFSSTIPHLEYTNAHVEDEATEAQSNGEDSAPDDQEMEDGGVDETHGEVSNEDFAAGGDKKFDNEIPKEDVAGNNDNHGKDDVVSEAGTTSIEAGSGGNTIGEQSVLFAKPNSIPLFVDMNTPVGCTEEVSFHYIFSHAKRHSIMYLNSIYFFARTYELNLASVLFHQK